jgi:uncharacterized protein (DUF2267 family)
MQPTVFNRTVQQTQEWLKELMGEGGITDEHKAYAALRAVLQHLRDRLTVEEAAHLADQLPTLVRGIYYEGWSPAGTPTKDRSQAAFLEAVREKLSGHPEIQVDIAVRRVFALLSRHVTGGEIQDVRDMLPKHVQELWPTAA